ncbi:MAG: LppW family protein [Mycobacterium sp.]
MGALPVTLKPPAGQLGKPDSRWEMRGKAMRRRPQTLVTASAAMVIAVPIVAGCEAKVYGDTPSAAAQWTVVAPMGSDGPQPDAARDEPAAVFDGLISREQQATSDAAKAGADLSAVVLDRSTNQVISNGNATPNPIASVAKVFIADDLLLQEAKGQTPLSADDRSALDAMLRSSDDNAANEFWDRGGGSAIITRVAARYGLGSTTPPYDGQWWNTMSTAADLVHYYDMLLNGTGGLPAERAQIILSNLAQSTPSGDDGYPQRFGIPDGLPGEQVAVKQGWMCCWNGGNWMHMSTGVIGSDRRYVMAINSMQPSDDSTARSTLTLAVKTMFPGGRI